ncbi:MAG: efflux RND transporter periplasmic adaptor subunit, partial [Lachnospiraceae bacterium]|nr:efflux RND transporter periplasmic adaptor subunit [Lachnospiraceae bacterium]
IYSTIDGVVSYIMLHRVAMASKGYFAIAVSDYGNLYVRSAFVSNREFMSAQRCYITHNGNEYDVIMRPYDTAEVKKLLDSGIQVYSYFDYKDPDVPLEMGTYVDLRVESGSSKNVMILPVNAVYTDSEKSYVYKNVDGRKVMTEIKKGIVNSAYVEIVSGLEEGDEVYVKP